MIADIDKPGVYVDLPAEAYHADPCAVPSLSCSIAELLFSACPQKARVAHPRLNPALEPKTDEKFDLGSAAHAMTLQDDRPFAVIDAADYRTKEAKAARDQARSTGKIPLLTEQYERTRAMVAAGKPQFEQLEDGHPFINGKPEVTLIWSENLGAGGPTWFRIRLDWLRDDRAFFPDYKWTQTSAHPDALPNHIYRQGYDFRAAFYRRGIRAVLGIQQPKVRFYFQEDSEPYLVSPWMQPTPHALDLADRKVAIAIERWRRCMETGIWPGYPTHGCYFDPPGWHEAQFEERVQRDRLVEASERRGTPAQRQRAAEFQAPHDTALGAGE